MEAVKMLCKQPRANLNAVDSEGRTALMYAAEYGHYDCCEVLINNKPSPDLNQGSKSRFRARFLSCTIFFVHDRARSHD